MRVDYGIKTNSYVNYLRQCLEEYIHTYLLICFLAFHIIFSHSKDVVSEVWGEMTKMVFPKMSLTAAFLFFFLFFYGNWVTLVLMPKKHRHATQTVTRNFYFIFVITLIFSIAYHERISFSVSHRDPRAIQGLLPGRSIRKVCAKQ